MKIDLYGIKNCDTVKKARNWLESHDFNYTFHDFRADGIDAKSLKQWEKAVGKDALINKRSTTWKQLSDKQQALFIGDQLGNDAIDLILEQPTLVKRPVLATGDQVAVGFKAENYQQILN